MRSSSGKIQSIAARTMLVMGAALLAIHAAAAQAADTSIGLDVTNQYFYRGLLQEDKGVIVQPWVDFVFPLYEGENTSWSFNLGIWNSLHDGPTGTGSGMSMHYELDAYVGFGVDFAERWSSALSYSVLSGPNSAFATVQEINVSISLDDSRRSGGESSGFSGLQPYLAFAWEIDGQSDGGREKGIYVELGIEPGFDLNKSGNHPLSASFPVLAGFSLSNYYEDAAGNDDSFGFAQGGVSLSVPLSFAPGRATSWTLSGGASILFLGDNLRTINGGDDSELIVSLGLEYAF